MTSNVGSRQLKDFGKGIGFNAISHNDNEEYSNAIIKKALEKTFAPEFINRLDDIIPFKQLDRNDLIKITDIELKELFKRVERMGYFISITDEAKNIIAQKGEDINYGARPIKRAIQNNIEDKLAEFLMDNEPESGAGIIISAEGGNEIIIKMAE